MVPLNAVQRFQISTHALTEGDYSPDMLVVSAGLFQLTPSRRATGWFVLASLLVNISTHALTEGDGCCGNGGNVL